MTQPPLVLLPDIPGLVHGIVSLNPPTIQCDGCGITYSHPSTAHAVITSGIQFHHTHPELRLCRDCRSKEA